MKHKIWIILFAIILMIPANADAEWFKAGGWQKSDGTKTTTGDVIVEGTVTIEKPVIDIVSNVATPAGSSRVRAVGGFLFVASGTNFSVYDIVSTPGTPILISTLDTSVVPSIHSFNIVGDVAYAAAGSGGAGVANYVIAIDIKDKSNMSILSSVTDSVMNGCSLYDFNVKGNYGYAVGLACDDVFVFRVADPSAMEYVTVETHANLMGGNSIIIVGDYLIIGTSLDTTTSYVNSVKIDDPTDPVWKNSVAITGSGLGDDPYLLGSFYFSAAFGIDDIVIVNISEPETLVLVVTTALDFCDGPNGIFVAGDYAYVPCEGGVAPAVTPATDDGFVILDVGDFSDISVVASYFNDETFFDSAHTAWGVGNYIYMTAQDVSYINTIRVVGLKTPTVEAGIVNAGAINVIDNLTVGHDADIANNLSVGGSTNINKGFVKHLYVGYEIADFSSTEISSGTMTPTGGYMRVDVEGGSTGGLRTDDIDIIDATGLPDGAFLTIKSFNSNRDVVLRDGVYTQVGSANICLDTVNSFVLDETNQSITLRWILADDCWVEVTNSGAVVFQDGGLTPFVVKSDDTRTWDFAKSLREDTNDAANFGDGRKPWINCSVDTPTTFTFTDPHGYVAGQVVQSKTTGCGTTLNLEYLVCAGGGSTITLEARIVSLVVNGNTDWTASGTANEYYINNSASFYSATKPAVVYIDDVSIVEGTAGALNAEEWDFGDNDALGYSTVYIRLVDNADPDTKANDFVESASAACLGSGVTSGADVSGNLIAYPDSITIPNVTTSGVGTCSVVGTDTAYGTFTTLADGTTALVVAGGTTLSTQISITLGTADSLNIYKVGTESIITNELGQTEVVVCTMTSD